MGAAGPPPGYPGSAGMSSGAGSSSGMGASGPPPGYPGGSNVSSAYAAGGTGAQGPPGGYPGQQGPGRSDYAAAMRGQGMPGGYPGQSGMPGMSGGAAGRSTAEPDYTNPVKGAETFLAAAQAKDVQLLSDSVALRAPQEADPKTRPIFQKLVEGPQSVDQATIDLIHDALQDMRIVGTNTVRSTARLRVIVGRQEENGDQVTRTITMRREKAGWKVADVSGPRIIDMPAQMRNRGGGGPGAGGSGGYGSGASSGSSSGGGGAGSFEP
jgi:hypothetical protein